MANYAVTTGFTLGVSNAKTYHKDEIASSASLGQANADRLLRKGYIRILTEAAAAWPEDGEYLSEDEINALKKPQLIKYAAHIGCEVNPKVGVTELRAAINSFIEDATNIDNENDAEPE
jgi:hypothetical protein